MELMPVMRSQLPLQTSPPPVEGGTRRPGPPGEVAAVTNPQRAAAILAPRSANASPSLQLAGTDEDGHPAADARAAAEAARKAYIAGSRAAGISPLPLPGL